MSSKFSIENNELKRIRNDYLISLRLRVQSFLLSQSKAERDAALEIQYAIKPYGREFYVASIFPQTRFAKNLKQRLKKNKKFRDAVLHLRLDDLLNAIIDMTADIMENYNQRRTKNKETQNKRAGVKEGAYRDMKIMADVINFTAVMDRRNQVKESVADEYIFFINVVLGDFHTMLKSRNTKSKNRKAVKAAVRELVRTQKEDLKLLPVVVVNGEGNPLTGSGTTLSASSGSISSASSDNTASSG